MRLEEEVSSYPGLEHTLFVLCYFVNTPLHTNRDYRRCHYLLMTDYGKSDLSVLLSFGFKKWEMRNVGADTQLDGGRS